MRDSDGAPDSSTGAGSLPPEAMASASAEAEQAARRYLAICLEILNGYRPAAQIRPLSSPVDAAAIIEQLTVDIRRLRPPRRPAGRAPATVRLRRLRVCEPRLGVVEAAAVLGAAARTWAMAFRLERRHGSWVATTARLL